MQKFDRLFELLKDCPDGHVFNPWFDVDDENDISQKAPEIRRNNLLSYLRQRKSARYLLIAEAVGYQGGHFSGIAMTSERILLGQMLSKGITPDSVFKGNNHLRTSKPELKPNGFSEPTATIVWGAVLDSGIDPNKFLFWNIFPWHPYNPQKGMLSNRTPTRQELMYGPPIVKTLLKIFENMTVFAVGQKSAGKMRDMGIACEAFRHPARGGSRKFREQFAAVFRS